MKSKSLSAWRTLFLTFAASSAGVIVVYIYLFILGIVLFAPLDVQHDNAAATQFFVYLSVAALGPILIFVPGWICLFLVLLVMKGKPHPLILTGVGIVVGLIVGIVPGLIIGVESVKDVWVALLLGSPVALFGGVVGLVGGLLRWQLHPG